MDYKTKPTSLRDIRKYSVIVRRLFNVPRGGPFPVLQALEHLGEVFSNCNYIVVEDTRLPPKTMARCLPNAIGGFTIEIKQSVYDGAYEKGTGAFLAEETLKEARSEEDIREIIRTIESYLIRTKETIERVEKFVQELKEEKIKEIDMVKEEDKKKNDLEKADHALKV